MNDFWNGVGTYHFNFYNEKMTFNGFIDTTEFYAENENELYEFWSEFCEENGLTESCLIDIEFLCEDCI